MSKVHQNNNTNNTQITPDNQLFTTCAFDMDYFEVTKIEPLKRYEENVHLLNRIFSVNQENQHQSVKSKDTSNVNNINSDQITNTCMEVELDTTNNRDNDKISDLQKRVVELTQNNANNNKQNSTNLNNKQEHLNKTEIIDILNTLQQTQLTPTEEDLVKQVLNSIDEYEYTKSLIQKHKESNMTHKHQFMSIINNTKNLKSNDNDLENIIRDILSVPEYQDTVSTLEEYFSQYKESKDSLETNCENKNSKFSNTGLDSKSSIRPFKIDEKISYTSL